jgi:hypothetical protein
MKEDLFTFMPNILKINSYQCNKKGFLLHFYTFQSYFIIFICIIRDKKMINLPFLAYFTILVP